MKFNVLLKDFFTIILLNNFLIYCCEAQAPPIRCPQYFQYQSLGNSYIAIITLPSVVPGTTKINVQLSQRENLVTQNYYGHLSLYEDKETTANRISNGQPIYYRVDFPTPNVLPKITLISVNDAVICADNEYPPPSTTLRLMHLLTAADLGGSFMPYLNTQQQQQIAPIPTRVQVPQTPTIQQQATYTSPAQTQTSQVTTGPRTYAECGLENSVITPFIVGGQTLSPRQFPWLAAIYVRMGALIKFTCGGTLVSENTVITAAHCFNGVTGGIEVQLGHYDLEDYSENFETRHVKQLIKHPEFRATTLPDADVAILHLHAPVGFTVSIRPICLWNEQTDVNIIAGQKAAVAGWGEDETKRIQSKPKKANANIVSAAECQGALARYLVPGTARAICVRGSENSTPCRGDSGGGLVVFRNGRWILRGVISGGNSNDRGCLVDYTFFCDLAQHRSWLYRNII